MLNPVLTSGQACDISGLLVYYTLPNVYQVVRHQTRPFYYKFDVGPSLDQWSMLNGVLTSGRTCAIGSGILEYIPHTSMYTK